MRIIKKSQKSIFLHPKYWLTWIAFGILYLITRLPFRYLWRFSNFLAWFLVRFNYKRKRVIATNIAMCFPELSEQAKEKLLYDNLASSVMGLFEVAAGWWSSANRLHSLTSNIKGLEYLQQAQMEGKGVILLSLHFTTLEIGALILSLHIPLDALYRHHKNKLYEYMQKQSRATRSTFCGIPIERNDIKTMIRRLKNGHTIWYAPDQDYGREHSEFVLFFGNMTATITATSRIAKMSNAVVLPFVQYRSKDGDTYTLEIFSVWKNFPSDNIKNDCLRINEWAQSCILQNPEQYLWAHRRFKTRPNDADTPVYA